MKNWIPKSKIFRFSMAIAGLSILLYFAGLGFVLKEIEKITSYYRDSESEFSKQARFKSLQIIAEENQGAIETLRGYFIQKGDEVKFIEKIEEVAKSSSVKSQISYIDVKASADDPFKENINVRMTVEGSWNNVINFLDKLEKMPFGASIQIFNMDTEGKGEWSGFVEFIVYREK